MPTVLRPLAAGAQESSVRRIGVVLNGLPTEPVTQSNVATFEQGLRTLGWRNGQNLHIDYRWYAGNVERTRADIAELIALAPDLIVTSSSSTLAAAMAATKTLPIIFTAVTDPVTQGFVPNLPHPGGNVTGFATLEYSIGGKWLDLLKQMSPSLARVGFMFNPVAFAQFPHFLDAINAAAPAFGTEVVVLPVPERASIEPAIVMLAARPNAGLIVPTDTSLVVHHEQIIELAARFRLPAIYARQQYVEAGGLMFYGTNPNEPWRGAALYVDRILKGAKVGDLPIQTPVNFKLIINARALQSLGLEMPLSLMMRADEVIE
jgi:putative ABC transport system substrate-binding protein